MLDLIKKFFKKEEPIVVEQVSEDKLEEWLDQKISQINCQEHILSFYNMIKDKKVILNEKIEILENVEFDEKQNVEEKIKNIVLGHKTNYVNATRQFLDKLNIPEGVSLTEAVEFSAGLNKELDVLSQRTGKSYQAAQHLFFNQVEDIFNVLGGLNTNVIEFNKKLERLGAFKISNLRKGLSNLNELNNKRKVLEKEINWKREKLNRCLAGKSKQKAEITKLKESDDYAEFTVLKEKEEKLKNMINDNNDEVHLFFSKMDRGLRKYERVSMEPQLIQKYLDNPVKALEGDQEFKIINLFNSMEKSMGEIESDEKKRIQILDSIGKAKKGFLQEMMQRNGELQNNIGEIKSKLRRYNVEQQIEEAEYKLEHFGEQILMVKREMDEWNFKLNSLDGSKIVASLNESIKEVFKIDIRLS
jgi:hypothetical protein